MRTLDRNQIFRSAEEVKNFFLLSGVRISVKKSLLKPCGHTFYIARLQDGHEVVGSLDFIVKRTQRYISECLTVDLFLQWSN